MLYLSFHAGDEHYALPSTEIIEVLPQVHLRSVPQAPDYVAGILNYHEKQVPVIELCILFGRTPCRSINSTRLILAHYQTGSGEAESIALLVEQATTTICIDEAELEAPVLEVENAPYLHSSYTRQGEDIQLISINNLLPKEVEQLLYPASEKDSVAQ